MKTKTAKELLQMANELEAKASVKDNEYAAALMKGNPADELLKESVKLRNEAEGARRAAIEAAKSEAKESEQARINEIRQALINHEGFKTKAEQKKAEAVKLITAGVTLLTEAGQLAMAADNVKSQYMIAVPPTRGRILSVYQTELLRLYVVLKRLKGSLTSEELLLMDALEKFK